MTKRKKDEPAAEPVIPPHRTVETPVAGNGADGDADTDAEARAAVAEVAAIETAAKEGSAK